MGAAIKSGSPGQSSHGAYYPGQEGGLTGWQGFAASTTGGLGGYVANKHNQAKTTQRRAREARSAEERRQAGIQSNVDQLNANFGIGDSAQAVANKGKLGAFYQNYQDSTEAASARSLDDRYSRASQQNRQQLASQGLGGSSVDYGMQRQNLSRYIAGRQQAVQSAQQSSRDLQHQNDQYRQGLQTQIQAGTAANPDWSSINNNLGFTLDSAKQNVAPTQIGEAFQTAGGLYGDAQVQQGATGSSFLRGAFSPSRSSSSSTGSLS